MLNDFADKAYLTADDPSGLKAKAAAARAALGTKWCCAVPVKRIKPAAPKRGHYYSSEFGSRILTEAAHKRIRKSAAKPAKKAA